PRGRAVACATERVTRLCGGGSCPSPHNQIETDLSGLADGGNPATATPGRGRKPRSFHVIGGQNGVIRGETERRGLDPRQGRGSPAPYQHEESRRPHGRR